MATLRRFTFDNRFDDDHPLSAGTMAEEEAAAATAPEPEVVAPTFSEAELKAAQEQAFAAGREDGLRSAGDTIEQRSSAALASIAEKLGKLFEVQAAAADRAANDAAAVAVAMVRKVIPALAERGAVEEVVRVVAEAMELVRDEPRVVIRVHDSLRDALAERIEALTVRYGYEGQIVLSSGSGLDIADCEIDWTSGGAARDSAALWRELDSIVARNLGDAVLPPAPDKTSNSEENDRPAPDSAIAETPEADTHGPS